MGDIWPVVPARPFEYGTLLAVRELKALDGHSDWVRSVAFSPDSQLVRAVAVTLTSKSEIGSGEEILNLKAMRAM